MELFAVSWFVASIQKMDSYFSSSSGEEPPPEDDDDDSSDDGDKTIRCAYSAAISVFPIPLTPWSTTILDLTNKISVSIDQHQNQRQHQTHGKLNSAKKQKQKQYLPHIPIPNIRRRRGRIMPKEPLVNPRQDVLPPGKIHIPRPERKLELEIPSALDAARSSSQDARRQQQNDDDRRRQTRPWPW